MTPRSFLLTPELAEYVKASSEAPDEVTAALVAETAAMAERGEVPGTITHPDKRQPVSRRSVAGLGVRRPDR